MKKPLNNKEKFSDEFIAQRQEGLDRFLQRTIHHSELVDSPCLLPFLTANPTDWEAAIAKAEQEDRDAAAKAAKLEEERQRESDDTVTIDAHSAMHSPAQQKKPGVFGKWFAAKKEQWALQNKNLILEETPAEAKKFNDLQTYAEHLEVCTRILSEDYKKILEASGTLAERYQSMGATYAQMWGEHELSNTSSSNLYQTLGQTWATVSKRIEDHIHTGQRRFDNPVDDLLMDIIALKDALAKRKAALYNYTKQCQEGRVLNEQMDKLRANADFSGQQDRYYQLEKDIRRSDVQIDEMKKQCELVSSRLLRDIERFRVEWHERMRQVLEDFHKRQIEFLQQQAMDFSTALPALSALDSSRSQVPTSVKPIERTEINMSYTSAGAKVSIGSIPLDTDESFPEEAVAPASCCPTSRCRSTSPGSTSTCCCTASTTHVATCRPRKD